MRANIASFATHTRARAIATKCTLISARYFLPPHLQCGVRIVAQIACSDTSTGRDVIKVHLNTEVRIAVVLVVTALRLYCRSVSGYEEEEEEEEHRFFGRRNKSKNISGQPYSIRSPVYNLFYSITLGRMTSLRTVNADPTSTAVCNQIQSRFEIKISG